ncbi:TrbI/VirB10 family protein [Methylobacter psychrophilus]|uniref:TrbI/VirB10 family protein n=1 Tax=Methylobacter psychrophilus TaxID=96941 RepID=UPI0021D4C2FB|nr:TrbI/VirB10 family protein [Methylobacter psychrophilus]
MQQQSTENEDTMSPALSPGEASESSGVRRVNNLPLFLIGGATLTFLVIMVLVAADRAAKQNRVGDKTEQEKVINTSMAAHEIAGNYLSGLIPIATKPLEMPPLPMASETPAVTRPASLDAPPQPPNQANQPNQPPTPGEDLAARIRQVKLQQFEEAVKSKTTVSIVAPRSPGSAPVAPDKLSAQQALLAQQIAANQSTETDPIIAYKKRLAQLKDTGIINNEGSTETTPQLVNTAASAEDKNNINQYANNGQGDRWRLDAKPEPPHSPYELRAGFVIPGTLISGVNSQLPGQIMAQTSQDVFDTATGKHKLFPQGSRLVGTYSSEVAYGQARVLIAWQRLIFPDGKAMDIGAMPGADGAGYAGFKDQVDNHYARIFGSALLMSAITAGAAYSQQNQNTGSIYAPNAQSTLSSALGQQLGQATVQMITKNMNIAPTLEIRPGYRFNILVTKDLTLSKPYEAFDY